MTYLDRFVGETASRGPEIEQRLSQLIEQIKPYLPDTSSIDDILDEEKAGKPQVELAWVKILDPRPRIEVPGEIEVQPVLPIEWIDDGSGFDMIPGVQRLILMGKTPFGEEKPIGYMTIPPEDDVIPELVINTSDDDDGQSVDWKSADAELWLTIAEAALWSQ